MPYAVLHPNRTIRQVVDKPSPFLKLGGGSIVRYNPPEYDPELAVLVPTQPVAVGEAAVSFTVVPKDNAAVVIQNRALVKFTKLIQDRLDAFAKTRNYDGILSACSYANSTDAQYKADAARCVLLRDNTWTASYTILAQVQAGTRPMPTKLADIEADLPILTWS